MPTPILELRDVAKHYTNAGRRNQVLRDINLSVQSGEFVALVGYSGAGKSTLVSLIAGLLMPDAGSVNFNGAAVRGPGSDRGVVFQNYSLLPWLTVSDNVALAVDSVFAKEPTAARQARVQHYVNMVGLGQASNKKPGELSGGMRQRVAVARALAMEPELLLMDEPLSALDALTRANLQRELARICADSGKTILLITNDVDEAILLADRIIPLGAGPAATLGASIEVAIARPRERKALNHDKHFKAIRAQVIDYLLSSAQHKRTERAASQPSAAGPLPAEATR